MHSKPYPTPVPRPALPLSLEFSELGTLYPSEFWRGRSPSLTASSVETFPEDRIDVPRMQRVLDTTVRELAGRRSVGDGGERENARDSGRDQAEEANRAEFDSIRRAENIAMRSGSAQAAKQQQHEMDRA